MKKPFISVIAAVMCVMLTNAQDNMRRWEAEVFAGPNVGIGEAADMSAFSAANDSKALIGYSFGGEFRYNFKEMPLDLGMRVAFSKIGYDVNWQSYDTNNQYDYWSKSYYNSFNVAAVGDWKFDRGGAISPFVGAGVGLAFNENYGYDRTKFFLMPRAGVDIKNHIRISVSANISDVSHNNMLLSVGYRFGGTPTRRYNPDGTVTEMPADVRRLIRQSNTCMWTGVGALCLGLPTVGFGLAILAGYDDPAGAAIGGVITGVGGLMTLSSVPLFIVSHKKKNEALRMSLNMTAMSEPSVIGSGISTPGMGVSLAF